MSDEQIALARRAVACKGWRWMPGMATNSKFRRVVDACPVERVPCCAEEGATYDDCHAVWLEHDDLLPDLTDPATLGCLLALVREAWGDDAIVAARADALEVFVAPLPGGFAYEVMLSIPPYALKHRFLTEAEAFVAALEAAPCGQ